MNNNISHIEYSTKSRNSNCSEFFFLQYRDNGDHFRFESAYKNKDLIQGRQEHQLETLNSFYQRKRSSNHLHTLYALYVDIDGTKEPFPLSAVDILERWRELGFANPPSEIRRTSNGRFHVIFRIKPARAFPDKISYWKKCAKGLYLGFKDIGSDEMATTNPVGFVRIPGHTNFKHLEKPIVELITKSGSIFTLSEIHQTLLDNGVLQPAIKSNKSLAEKISILQKGVPPGIGNYSSFTLAIYYKGQGVSEDEASEKLLIWNDNLQSPDPSYKVKNTVRSAYKNGYGLSMKALNKWVSIALEWQNNPTVSKYKKPAKIKAKRDKIRNYSENIRAFLEANGGQITISQRGLARSLNIPFRSFSHAIKKVPGLSINPHGKGRSAKTEFTLGNVKQHLRLIHTKTDVIPIKKDLIIDAIK